MRTFLTLVKYLNSSNMHSGMSNPFMFLSDKFFIAEFCEFCLIAFDFCTIRHMRSNVKLRGAALLRRPA